MNPGAMVGIHGTSSRFETEDRPSDRIWRANPRVKYLAVPQSRSPVGTPLRDVGLDRDREARNAVGAGLERGADGAGDSQARADVLAVINTTNAQFGALLGQLDHRMCHSLRGSSADRVAGRDHRPGPTSC